MPFGNMTVRAETIIKDSGRKYCGCNPNNNRISRNPGEMHSSHVYRGMVNQEEGRLNNCLKRSYAS